MSNDVRVQVPSLAPFPFSAEVNTACGCGGMADALASGASVRKDVGVQVPPSAPSERASNLCLKLFFCTFYGVQFCDVIREKPVSA